MAIPTGTPTTTSSISNLVQAAYDQYVRMALRSIPVMRSLADVKPVQQAMPGSSVVFSIYSDLAQATSTLTETSDVSSIALGNPSQVTVTLNEYGSAVTTTKKLNLTSFNDVDSALADIIAYNAADSIDNVVGQVLSAGTNVMMDAMATSLYNNTTNTQQFTGLPAAVSDSGTYGNIDRSTYTWWKSKQYAAGSVNPTRQNILQYISGTVKNGAEVPTFGVCGFGTWTLLAQDYVGQEQYVLTPGSGFDGDSNGPQSGFRALMVAGVPIYPDPYCPEGTVYFLNSNYLSLYIHEQGSFVFTGFESTLPNWQIGYVGAVLMIAELVNTKPKAMTKVTGYNSLTI